LPGSKRVTGKYQGKNSVAVKKNDIDAGKLVKNNIGNVDPGAATEFWICKCLLEGDFARSMLLILLHHLNDLVDL